ncbi:hypothetical protein ACN27F_08370 [Solwaraspora sp. WMMB335]|uniref:hypothetical protein n=1 Tax=Solwaraspora sp. WMMB335 TaxID=3404118 RepID=UPI003B93F3FF
MYVFSGVADSGGTPLDRLRELAARPENTRFFRAVTAAVRDAFDHVGEHACRQALPGGLPLADWLRGTPAPPDALTHSLVQAVCAHAYQLCLLQPGPRPPDSEAIGEPVAAVGHSMGVQAAIAAGRRGLDRRAFIAFSQVSIGLATVIMLRCHEVSEARGARQRLAEAYAARAGTEASAPTPMAGLTAISEADLRRCVAEYQGDEGPVEVAIVNSERSHVLAGTPDALVDFWLAHADRFDRDRVRWAFLASTAPFHSSLLAPAVALIHRDGRAIGYQVHGVDLSVPVYVADAPHNLQQRADLLQDFLEQAICRPVDWRTTVTTAVAAARPDRVVDFGPGNAARLFTRESLRGRGYPLRFQAVPH